MGAETPNQVATAAQAVFLSYASQDADAARRICDALRAAGIEVWFDQSELRGGDAWDQSIRKQIKSCALFLPIISKHTHERAEGYFRLEWKLAVDRCHLMAADKAFLVPVVIDDTADDEERVPEKFREVQWTRLVAGETRPEFVTRIQKLLSAEAAPLPTTAHRQAAVTPRRSSRLAPLFLGAMLAAVTAYLLIEKPWTARSVAFTPPAHSIAVLPLANESGDASQQYFSDGISEDLITRLSQFQGLKVIGRTSAFQFRDSKEDSRSIGAKLGVAHLLEGSVRRSGETVRVSTELIDTADGSTQWSERYDRPYKDLFVLQDEITRAVAGALRAKLFLREHAGAQSDRPSNGSLEAYSALLQGRFYASRNTEADYRKASEYFRQATELDPSYALAWSELSDAWAAIGYAYLAGASAQEAYANARVAAERALALSPELAAAHFARCTVLDAADFNWRDAEAECRRALTLAPNDSRAKAYLAIAVASLGKVQEAIDLAREALAIDPLRANTYNWLATFLSAQNRLDDAERAIRKALELQPAAAGYHQTLTIIEVQRGNAPQALDAAQHEPLGYARDFAVALARQIGNDRRAADVALNNLVDKDANISAYGIAQVYALRGDANETFVWLDRAWSNRDDGIANLLFDPFILRYKDDPRFAAFCRQVGLPTPAEVGRGT